MLYGDVTANREVPTGVEGTWANRAWENGVPFCYQLVIIPKVGHKSFSVLFQLRAFRPHLEPDMILTLNELGYKFCTINNLVQISKKSSSTNGVSFFVKDNEFERRYVFLLFDDIETDSVLLSSEVPIQPKSQPRSQGLSRETLGTRLPKS